MVGKRIQLVFVLGSPAIPKDKHKTPGAPIKHTQYVSSVSPSFPPLMNKVLLVLPIKISTSLRSLTNHSVIWAFAVYLLGIPSSNIRVATFKHPLAGVVLVGLAEAWGMAKLCEPKEVTQIVLALAE